MRRCLVLVLLCVSSLRCATVTSGPEEQITLSSTPDGAEVVVDCGSRTSVHVTPARVAIPRGSPDCTLTFEKNGFQRETVLLEKGINARAWFNIPIAVVGIGILGVSGFSADPADSRRQGAILLSVGLGGLAVDALNARLRDHDPKKISVVLRANGTAGNACGRCRFVR